ncbi:hypothetical protein ACHWQZ_G012248 [Mnemiopsis leidyi]
MARRDGRVLEDDWKVTRAREQGLTAGGPRRLKTVVSTVKNLLAVSRDAKSWQDQIKQMQVKAAQEKIMKGATQQRRGSVHEPVIQSYDTKDNIQLAEHVTIKDLKELMSHFSRGESGPSSDIRLDKTQFMGAITELLANSQWEYLLGSPDWEKRLDMLFNKVDASCDGMVDWNEFCTYMLLQYQEKDAVHNRNAPFRREEKYVKDSASKETITRVCYASNPSRYLSVTRDGNLSLWSMNMELQKSVPVCDSQPTQTVQTFQSGATPRKQRLWITDMCVMENVNKLVITTTSREMFFYDMSTKTYSVQFLLFELEYVPLCMTYWYNKADPGGRSFLIFGDDSGCLHIFNFLQPNKGLFESPTKKQEGHLKINMKDLSDHSLKVHHSLCMGGPVHSDWVRKVVYIPETDYILSCSSSSEQSMVLQDRLKKKKNYIYKVRKGINCFDFNKNLNIIATGSTDHTVRLWNPYVESKPTALLKGHQTSILDVAIHESAGQVFSYSMDVVLKVYDIKEHTCLQTVILKFPRGSRVPDHGPFVLHIQKKVTSALIVCSNDCMAEFRMGNRTNNNQVKAVQSHAKPISCCAYSPQTHQIMTGCEGSVVTVWDINTGAKMLKLSNTHGKQEITCMSIDTGGKRLLTGARNGNVKVWNFNNGHCLKKLEGLVEAEVTGILAFSEKSVIYTAGWNKCINVYRDDKDAFYLRPQPEWRGGNVHKDDILTTAYCPPNLLATASFDGEIIVWSTETQKIFRRFRSGSKPVRHRGGTKRPSSRAYQDRPANNNGASPVDKVIFLEERVKERRNEDCMLVSSESGHAFFWNIYGVAQCGGYFQTACRDGESVLAMCTDSQNKRLVCGDTAGYIAVYDIRTYCTASNKKNTTPKRLTAWHGHCAAVTALEHIEHENGLFLVSCSTDSTVRMWNVHGHFVGTFGQDLPWNLGDRSTFKYPQTPFEAEGITPPTYIPSIDGAVSRSELAKSAMDRLQSPEPDSSDFSPDPEPPSLTPDYLGPDRAEKESQPNGVLSPVAIPRIVDRTEPWETKDLESWLNTTTGSTILGESWDRVYRKRMITRQERRHAVGTTDTKLALRFGHHCSPFAALATPVMTDVAIPKDLPKTPRMVNNNYGFEAASDNPKKLTIRFTPDPIVQAVAKKSMTHNQSRPNSQVGLLK